MSIRFRSYADPAGVGKEYEAVRAFLVERASPIYTYARWDWMTTHSCLERESVPDIGLWEDDGRLVALATFDCQKGDAYCLTAKGYERLYPDTLAYAARRLASGDGEFFAVIDDADEAAQRAAFSLGMIATPEKEHVLSLEPERVGEIRLPEGFSLTSLDARFDLFEYGRVLWKGFGHEPEEGPFAPGEADVINARAEMLRPHVDLSLKLAAVAPDGHFAGYCGMWYEEGLDFAVVEPMAVDPAYRRLGLGRAALWEAAGRCFRLGAKRALVGSNQQFYFSIGFRPFASAAKWRFRIDKERV